MKTGILTTKTIASDDILDTKSIMGMSSKGMEMAQYFLRDKIYSDKVLAVVREYICNAQDEHKKYNIDKNVDVKLEKIDSKWIWSVRDYAMGLNEYDIRNVFGMYFESTKSNENDSVGGFGIGGKAGFSYTDTFYINSHHNGTKSCYVCTLGSGTKGIPVGEIYKISEEPTTEQGIEISLDVDKDARSFSKKTYNLVEFYLPNTNILFEDGYLSKIYSPLPPDAVKSVGDYVFNTYASHPNDIYIDNRFLIRMGGVVYPYNSTSLKPRQYAKCIIVDVPIGKLSIPISRESIENTPLNEKVFDDINKCLDLILDEEGSTITVPKFGAVCTGNEEFNKTYTGEWFIHQYRNRFQLTDTWQRHVARIGSSDDCDYTYGKVSKGPVHIVYLIPDIKNIKSWLKRISQSLKTIQGVDFCGFPYMRITHHDKMFDAIPAGDTTIDLSDVVFVDVKTLKLPKLAKGKVDDTTYLVYDQYGYKTYHTPESLDAFVRKQHFNDADLEDDWYNDCKSMSTVSFRTIGRVSDHGTRSNFYTVNSVKMIESLTEDFGWLTPSSPEWTAIKGKFDEEYRIKRLVETSTSILNSVYFGSKCNDNIKKLISKHPHKIHRFERVKATILGEDSTRGRILKSLQSYDRSITRMDLRKILMMKD